MEQDRRREDERGERWEAGRGWKRMGEEKGKGEDGKGELRRWDEERRGLERIIKDGKCEIVA